MNNEWPAQQTEMRPVSSLIAYALNARTHSDLQVDLFNVDDCKRCECGCEEIVSKGKRYISGHNSRFARKPKVEKVCVFCKNSFSGTAAAICKRVYCSTNCRDEHRRTLTGVLNKSYTSIEMKCEICGNVFITTPARLKNSQVYCSMECGREGRRVKISGTSRNTRPFGKQKAKVRDQFKCKICNFDLIVHAHHIIPKKDGGSDHIDNIITLCPNHHAMAHAGLLSVEEMKSMTDPITDEKNKLITKARNALNFRAVLK